jgi:protein phosphatase
MKPTREIQASAFDIEAVVRTDVGCVRESNEDNGRHVVPNAPNDHARRGTLTIVADGMGGHSAGEVASEMAVDLTSSHFYSEQNGPVTDALQSAIESANAEIFETSISDTRFSGMGTTIVALAIQGQLGYAAHVGDSRLYRLRGNEIDRLTIDHSQVMEMVRLGLISIDEAQDHEDKNVILRALGTQPEVEVEMSTPFEIAGGDQFLLCSDGLSDLASDEEIGSIWIDAADPYAACDQLIDLAKQKGGSDNITVGIVKISPKSGNNTERRIPATREIEA